MTMLTVDQAKALFSSGKAAQTTTMYNHHSNKTFGVVDNRSAKRTDHYLIGDGDLTHEVPEKVPTFDRHQ
ncbi:MAG: hypothetical protein KBF58_08420 [Methyloversatilis sp.]|jgi:hypothetical protein|nr:hypothetical protein [Methyloversatilis sp.]MBP6195715.1 hypothetical protein [Methyloversatilis sp.]MBP9118091.1 hypothetical protein [Methyloversatilis sp.]